MSSERSASAITSEPKPGALAPVCVGRSTLATAGSASLARAVAGGGVIRAFPRILRIDGGERPASNRIGTKFTSQFGRRFRGLVRCLAAAGQGGRRRDNRR